MTIVKTNSLSKRYNKMFSVKDLDLKVEEGCVYGFLGPNGAGKSTTLKMLLGLTKPTGGEIFIFGKQVSRKNRLEILREMGSLIENPSYYGHLTGWENLKIIQTLKGLKESHIKEVLSIVRLEEHQNKKAGQYSLGMKQRLGFAAALMGFPRLLILDEPTNGLDPAGIQELRNLIRRLPQDYGITVLVSSHLLSEIEQIADYVGIIRGGELVFQDQMKALREKGNRGLALRTLNNKAACAALVEKGIVHSEQDGMVLLPEMEDRVVAAVNRLLSERGVDLVRIEERKTSLEQIFLDLTGEAVSL